MHVLVPVWRLEVVLEAQADDDEKRQDQSGREVGGAKAK